MLGRAPLAPGHSFFPLSLIISSSDLRPTVMKFFQSLPLIPRHNEECCVDHMNAEDVVVMDAIRREVDRDVES